MRRIAAVVALALVAVAAPAHAKEVVTTFTGKNGGLPSSAPNCYKGSEVYNGVAMCFGATYVGGNVGGGGYGSLYRMKPDGTEHKVIYSFDVVHGLMPSQAPVLLSDEHTLAFTTSQGGAAGSGIVGTFDLKTGQEKVLAAFTGPGGSTAQGAPIQVGDTLYGLAGQGGANGYGVIWSLPLGGGTITVLRSFKGGTGDVATPFGHLTYNPADGLLYGMAFVQAANGMGGIFSISPNGGNYKLRASFSAATGGAPQMGALTLSSDGVFYGNTWAAGSKNMGTLFQYNPSNDQITALWNYSKKKGGHPYNSPAISKSGKWIYSATWQYGSKGMGTILALAKDGSQWKLLKTLDSTSGGQTQSNVSVAPKGKNLIVGMSNGGKGLGTVFAMTIPADYR